MRRTPAGPRGRAALTRPPSLPLAPSLYHLSLVCERAHTAVEHAVTAAFQNAAFRLPVVPFAYQSSRIATSRRCLVGAGRRLVPRRRFAAKGSHQSNDYTFENRKRRLFSESELDST